VAEAGSSQVWGQPKKINQVPALGRLRHENHQLEGSMGYMARPCLKKKQNNNIINFFKAEDTSGQNKMPIW
jgi:hypothetical protein